MTPSLLARLTPLGRVTGPLHLRRAWPRGEDRLLLEYADRGGITVAGQWHADPHRAEAIARATQGATWLPDPGVVLQPHGGDRRLPAIARLLAEPGASLVVHRPERRAVVRRRGPTYAKVVRPERAGAVLAADRAARETGSILVPDLLAADLDDGVLEWAALPGRSLYDLLLDLAVPVRDLARAGAAAGRAVGALHGAAAPPGVPLHGPTAEVETAARWARPATALSVTPPGLDRALHDAAELLAHPPTPSVLVHRDLHETQVLIDGDGAGLLDVDTLAVGEAAVDLANLLVHLDLRVALGLPPERSRAVADAFLDAYQPTPGTLARIPAYAASTRVRLACVYAFRPAEMAGAARLIEHATDATDRKGVVGQPAPARGRASSPKVLGPPPTSLCRPAKRLARIQGAAPRIAFALGKPPRQSSVVFDLLRLLRERDIHVAVRLPHDHAGAAPAWFLDVDLIVQRGLDPQALQALTHLEEAGIRCCNSIAATGALADRMLLARRLHAARVPVPPTRPAATWADARAVADDRPVVVKARDGRRGRGVHVVASADGRLPPAAPFDGPYIVQDRLRGDGSDRKLYVAGGHLRGLLKPSLEHLSGQAGAPFRATPELAHIGWETGQALGLDIFGVGIVVGPTGPHVVDVNPFPGFRGVPEAADLIACRLAGIALGKPASCTCADEVTATVAMPAGQATFRLVQG